MVRKFLRSIHARLLFWFVVISLVPLASVGITVSLLSRRTISERIKSELNIKAAGIAAKVVSFIETKRNDTVNFCSDGIIKDGLTYYDPDDPDTHTLVTHTNSHLIKNKLSLDAHLRDILILNLKGRVVFSANEAYLGRDESQKDYYLAISRYFKDEMILKRLRDEPRAIVSTSDFYISDDTKEPCLAVSNIVTARATGLPLGVLVNRYHGSMLDSFLEKESEGLGKTGKAYMANKDGYLLTSLKNRIDTKPVIQAKTLRQETLGIYPDHRGISVLGASAIIKDTGWVVIAEKDATEAFSPLDKLTAFIISFGLLCLVGAVFLSLFISQKISRPLHKISQIAGAVAQGDFEGNVEYASRDEIGYLVSHFNQMIQDLKKQRTQLLLDKAYIHSIISDMLDSLIVIDPKGIIKTANKATLDLLGYQEEELIGRPIADIFKEGQAPFGNEGFTKLIENGALRNYETAYKTKSTEEIPVAFSGSVMYKETDKIREPVGIIGVAHDLREIKKLHRELLQCDKLASLGTLTAGVAHEIKNPLAIIVQGLAYLKSCLPMGDVLSQDAIVRMEKAGFRAAKIVKDLLSFARQNPPVLQELDITSVIEETLSFVEHQISLKGIKIIRQFGQKLPLIRVDGDQMKQVFLNILLNAVDAMPAGGTMTIKAEEIKAGFQDSYLQMRFADTGCGIPAKDLPKVFDPFFSTKQKQGGAGLGLSVTKGIVEEHGGNIGIESEAGKGTTVIINLPR